MKLITLNVKLNNFLPQKSISSLYRFWIFTVLLVSLFTQNSRGMIMALIQNNRTSFLQLFITLISLTIFINCSENNSTQPEGESFPSSSRVTEPAERHTVDCAVLAIETLASPTGSDGISDAKTHCASGLCTPKAAQTAPKTINNKQPSCLLTGSCSRNRPRTGQSILIAKRMLDETRQSTVDDGHEPLGRGTIANMRQPRQARSLAVW